MTITPVEVRHLRFPRRPLGLGRRRVREELERVADAYEAVWRERADLSDHVEHLEAELARYRQMDEMLRRTLMSAERAVDAMREGARQEAEAVVRDSEARGREIVGEAVQERERLRRETVRLRDTEREFRTRLRSVVTSTEALVEAYEADLADDAA